MISYKQQITFPEFTGNRCLMMPYIQGDPDSVPGFNEYAEIISNVHLEPGEIGYLTIDESIASAGLPHRGKRAKYGRALHTEAGKWPEGHFAWGQPPHGWGMPRTPYAWGNPWGGGYAVTLEPDTRILLSNNLDNTCMVWNSEHPDTSLDGDLGDQADQYPLEEGISMAAGEVYEIGILTPHESLPVQKTENRQFLRIVGRGVHGREPYFTENPLVAA